MLRILILILLFMAIALKLPNPIFAIYDPLSKPNNTFGVHILFTDEISLASDLVNSKNGDWGYVTIPIQAVDRDISKWQKFMDDCRQLHIIPILRLSTTGDYFNTKVWEKPKLSEVLDFANFLNSLDWPTKNRYIIVFNEVNRGDEWGGFVSASEYAQILDYAVDAFKSKNQDFFVISAGLDNAAPQSPPEYINEYNFIIEMNEEIPGIFSKVDGISSHAYPNPAFSAPPRVNTRRSIHSFKYESELTNELAGKTLPIFITETGWSQNEISEAQIASYYKEAFETVWNDPNIVAVTPFILRSAQGPFKQFSLLSENGDKNLKFKAIEGITKIKGQPELTKPRPRKIDLQKILPIKNFLDIFEPKNLLNDTLSPTKALFKWLLNIE